MSLFGLRQALANLDDALADAGIAFDRKDITIELSYEAGKRFELWFLRNVNLVTMPMSQDWVESREGFDPVRWVELDGIKITWPLKLVALPSGRVVAEPMVQVLELGRAE